MVRADRHRPQPHLAREALQILDWLPGDTGNEVEVFVYMKHCCARKFGAGGDQEIRHRGRSVQPSLGEQSLHGHRACFGCWRQIFDRQESEWRPMKLVL